MARDLGTKLGPALARILADTLNDHYHRSSGHRAKVGVDAANLFFHQINREFRDHLTPHLAAHHANIPDDEPLKKLTQFLVTQPGEGSALIAIQAAGSALGTGLGSGLSALFAPENQRILQQFAPFPLPAQTAAALAAAGIVDYQSAEQESRRNGIDYNRFGHLYQAALNYGELDLLLELRRRGLIDDNIERELLQRLGYSAILRDVLPAMGRVHLLPAQAADMVLRGWLSEDDGRQVAKVNGMTPGDFDLLVKDTGEPPATEELLFAFRRGFINRARLQHGIKESRVRDEWIDVVERLRYSPPSTSDALRGVIQGHLSDKEGERIADENGLEPGNWRWLAETEGEPPGHQQMLELWNRRAVSKAEVVQSIKESRLKNKYIDAILALRRRLPSERIIIQAVAHNAMTDKHGLELLVMDGYEQADAEALIRLGRAQATHGAHALTRADVVAAFRDRLMPRPEAHKLLEALGYTAHDADLVLELANAARELADMRQAVQAIRSRYVAHHIDKNAAHADLIALGVPPDELEHHLKLWDVLRSANVRRLSEAQVASAVHHGVRDAAWGKTRLLELGYPDEDANVLLEVQARTKGAVGAQPAV